MIRLHGSLLSIISKNLVQYLQAPLYLLTVIMFDGFIG